MLDVLLFPKYKVKSPQNLNEKKLLNVCHLIPENLKLFLFQIKQILSQMINLGANFSVLLVLLSDALSVHN